MTIRDGINAEEDFHIVSKDKEFGMLEDGSG
jgi:hypothetical protein